MPMPEDWTCLDTLNKSVHTELLSRLDDRSKA